jgi:RNA ligase
MIFPLINSLDQIRNAIDIHRVKTGGEEFIIAERDDYFVANYMVGYESTFPPIYNEDGSFSTANAILRECRGIMFDKQGNIISRPFHKFFNLNQLPETQAHVVDMTQPYDVLDKMDGSMIRPVLINGVVRLCTKMGLTDEGKMAEEFFDSFSQEVQENYKRFIEVYVHDYTPIFEYCSRRNQIVIDYPEDKLVLTAMRHNITGEYVTYRTLKILSKTFSVPLVESMELGYPEQGDASLTSADIASIVKDWKGVEGIVIRFADGQMIKIKAEDYCIKHHAKDSLLLEKNLIKLYLEEKIDDILPLLDDTFRGRVDTYIKAVEKGINFTVASISKEVEWLYDQYGLNRREQASYINQCVQTYCRPILFGALDGRDVRGQIIRKIIDNTGTANKLDSVRPLFDAVWV